ncbi:MAG: T9SS type A sorting domain-containing protein [Bacteroidetes bacterium]|nr:T9SS type A sorting domain-containing protein [Bacteroidota bacterium]
MKSRIFTSLIFSLLGVAAVQAQPSIPGSAFPAAGSTFQLTLADTTGVQAGAGGAATTWSFGSLSPNGAYQYDTFTTPSSTRYGALFPSADIALHEVNPSTNYFVYYQNDAANGFYKRIANVQPDTVIYSDPANEFPYPLSFSNNYNDTYYAHYHSGTGFSTMAGSVTGVVDGYGTLTTPAGTFYNVVRLHAHRVEHDTVTVSGNSYPVLADFEYYTWYQDSAYFPIMLIGTTNVSSAVINRHAKLVGYRAGYNSGPSGVTDVAAGDNKFLIYPNPATQLANIIFDAGTGGQTEIGVYDMAGHLLRQDQLSTPGGVQVTMLATGQLPAGLYEVRVQNNAGTHSQKLEVTR